MRKAQKIRGTPFSRFPHSFVLFFGIIVFVAGLTYIVPAGKYDKITVNGKQVVDPASFHYIESTPTHPFEIFTAIPKGINSAAFLITMILIIGGSIRVFESTGAIKAAVMSLKKGADTGNDLLILAVIMTFFACLGGFPGMLEAAIPFAPLCISIALALKYDAIVGICISLVPIAIGWTAGPSNPWTVGIGQNLAELPMFSGFFYRLFILVVMMALTMLYVFRYAARVKRDPTKSVVYGMDISHLIQRGEEEHLEFTLNRKIVLLVFVATIAAVVFGALKLKWGIPHMCGAYLIGSIVGGVTARFSSSKIADELLEGGKIIFVGAMAVGIARGISIVMKEGNIADTIVYYISSLLSGLPNAVTAVGMFLVQTVINFFIPSGSGQALVTLPILLPVADIIDLNRQIAILAFQFGDGLSNLCYPTVGGLVAFLMYAKIPFNKWFKFIFPFMLMAWGTAILLLIGAVLLNFGPF